MPDRKLYALARGQECPRSVACSDSSSKDKPTILHSSFLDPSEPITKYRHVLPHWEQKRKWMFATWRLKDSLPVERLWKWHEEKTCWLKEHPEPWDKQTEAAYHHTFSDRINLWLDQGSGACVLSDPMIGQQVANVLLYDHNKTVEIDCFVIMPNHVHVLFRLFMGSSLNTMIKSWKGISARRINQRLGQSGALWQEGYWDQLIRSEKHFYRIRRYIHENPQKARVKRGYILWERGHSCPPMP